MPDTGWAGTYREPETSLVVRLKPLGNRRLHVEYARTEILDIDGQTASKGGTSLSRADDGLWMTRAVDHLHARLEKLHGASPRDITGRYHSAELDATLVIESAGGVLYGWFEGWLGAGIVQPVLPAGPDVWRLPCPRALDFAAPGDWTLSIRRNGSDIAAIEVGCWLARQVNFTRA
jgi:D-aminopeptidase